MIYKVKLPKGKIFNELIHYMGGDDSLHFNQRPKIAQQLIDKMIEGKFIILDNEELLQLIKDTVNAIDILKDHVYPGEEWNPLTQYHLVKFYDKLKNL